MLRDVLELNAIVLRSKYDVLREIDSLMTHSDNSGYVGFLKRFEEDIRNADVPTLKAPYHAYEIDISSYEALLSELVFSDVTVKDGEITDSTTTLNSPLVTTRANMLSVEQYAKEQGVKPLTVRQWIRRGKLCDAKKNGREWLIPATEGHPRRGYPDCSFSTTDGRPLNGNLVERFSYLRGITGISIIQRDDDKGSFDVWVHGGDADSPFSIDAKEREALVLALISSPKMESDGSINFIMEKSAQFRDAVPCLSREPSPLDESLDLLLVETPHLYGAIQSGDSIGADYEMSMEYSDITSVAWNINCFCNSGIKDLSYSWYEHRNKAISCGTISGYLIDCGEIRMKGEDPWGECDALSGDLEYMAGLLFLDDGPLGEEGYDPYACVFYIDDIALKDGYQNLGIELRLLRELPYLCKKFLGTAPSVLAWIEGPEDKRHHLAERVYEPSGFARYKHRQQLFVAYSWL